MIYIQRMFCAALATVAVVAAGPATAQPQEQHAVSAPPAVASSPTTCPMMMGMPMDSSAMPQHMAEMHQTMQEMHAEMQAMRNEMMQIRQEMQRRR